MSVNEKMTAIADEIRTLSGTLDKLNLDEMAVHTKDANNEVDTQDDLIEHIRIALQGKTAVGEAKPVIEFLEITENGTYTAPDGVDGYSPVAVNVPIPDGYIKPSGTLEVTENGEYYIGEYESIDVNVRTDGGITPDDIASAGIVGDIEVNHSSIAAYAFAGNTGITSLSAPNATTVGDYAFYGTTGLVGELDLSSCTTIGAYAFCNSRGIESLSIPNVTSVGTNAFQYCNKITVLDAPNLTTLGGYAFSGNATYKMAFKRIHLPKCTAIPASTLTYCPNVTELVLPECKSVGNSSLTNWANLQYVDLPKCTSIANYGLRNNGKLETLILRSETMCTLSNYALNSSKIFNGTGYVYVPRALIASYQVATNWKTVYGKNANAFRALEDYTVDGTITGELDESKI